MFTPLYFLSATVITCPELNEVDDGSIEYSFGTTILTFGTIATHSCDEGFYLFGNETQACAENGTSIFGIWNDNTPECIGEFYRR